METELNQLLRTPRPKEWRDFVHNAFTAHALLGCSIRANCGMRGTVVITGDSDLREVVEARERTDPWG